MIFLHSTLIGNVQVMMAHELDFFRKGNNAEKRLPFFEKGTFILATIVYPFFIDTKKYFSLTLMFNAFIFVPHFLYLHREQKK